MSASSRRAARTWPARPIDLPCPHDPDNVSGLHAYAAKARRLIAMLSLSPAPDTAQSEKLMRCDECGPGVKIDEDGCCVHCGADAIDTRDTAQADENAEGR